ncbi:MAG: SET domain-containing protein [Myxococcales bacterium]|nr:SET domain-containing protein [Myxococcales bacterium]
MPRIQHHPPVFVAESPIHGRGIFARRRIRNNALIGEFQGRPTRRDGPHVLWISDESGLQVENELRFINHSEVPNAEAHGTQLIALRNIQPGVEITMHYGDDWEEGSSADA